MRTLFQTIKQQFLEGNDLVLVSVTASSGSTPRGAGPETSHTHLRDTPH